MDVNIVFDENRCLRTIKQGNEDIDLTNLTFYIPKITYDTCSFSCILRQGDKDIIVPLSKTTNEHSIYYLYKCDLLPVKIDGEYQLYIIGVDLSEPEAFISKNHETFVLSDNLYKIQFQVYSTSLLKSEIAMALTKIEKFTELNINIHKENIKILDDIKRIGGET